MHSINYTKKPDHVCYVVEPGELLPVRVVDEPTGEWNKLTLTVMGHRVILNYKGSTIKVSPERQVGFELANVASTFVSTHKGSLPRPVRYALGTAGDKVEHYFWRDTASEEWSDEDYSRVDNGWDIFILRPEEEPNHTVYGRPANEAVGDYYRLDIVQPHPWQKDLKRAFLLWSPGAKVPRRYTFPRCGYGDTTMVQKLEKSGIKVPQAIADQIAWWSGAKCRIFWAD